jgi:hypothetical protein
VQKRTRAHTRAQTLKDTKEEQARMLQHVHVGASPNHEDDDTTPLVTDAPVA